MTTIILKGNRSRPLSIRPNDASIISGIAYVNTWIQTCEPVDVKFVESFGNSESTWQVLSASSSDDQLLGRLKISAERLAELRKFREFGSLACVHKPNEAFPYSIDAVFVVAEKVFERIVNKLVPVTEDDHVYYALSVNLGHYPANHVEERLPSFENFKKGEPCYFDGGMFTTVKEKHPDQATHIEITRET